MSNTPSVPSKDELLAKGLQELINLYNAGKDFAIEQVPDVIKQLIIYNISIRIVWVVVAIAAMIALWRWGGKMLALHKAQTNPYYDGGFMALTVVFRGLGVIGGGAILLKNLLVLLKLTLAPKVWLLEYAAQLVK